MTAPCGLDCFNCAFFLAPEDPNARLQIEQWSKEYNIPLEIRLLNRMCAEILVIQAFRVRESLPTRRSLRSYNLEPYG